MKHRVFPWAESVLFSVVATLPLLAADEPMMVAKGRIYAQSGASAPVPVVTAGSVFMAQVPGLGGSPLVATAARVTLPSGGVETLTYESGLDLFILRGTADSPSALTARFPPGTYHLAYFGGALDGMGEDAVLEPDAFPGPVTIANAAAAQAIDAEADFEVRFSPPAGSTEMDQLRFSAVSGGAEVYSETVTGDQATLTLPGGAFEPGQDLEFRLRLLRRSDQSGTILTAASGFFSETRWPAKTVTGGGSVDTQPPSLLSVAPTNGAVQVAAGTLVVFQFSEAMNPAKVSVAWVPALDPAKLTTRWIADNQALMVSYEGGFPAGNVAWVLNPVPGASANFRDVAGNELPAGQARGSFSVSGGGAGCDSTDPVEGAGFGILKLVNHLQTDSGTPANDPVAGADLQAFARIANAPGRAAIEFPADPAPKPHQLKFFGQFAGTEFLSQHFDVRADLDAAYPAGDYDFQLRDNKAPTVVLAHLVLNLAANGYPTAPRFADHAAAQNIDTNADFTLYWDAFSGANPDVDGIALEIHEDGGDTVLSLPDHCANKPLSVTATSAVIPRGLLRGGGSHYTAILTFTRLNDHGKTMPGTSARGIAAVGRVTRMSLKTRSATVVPATAPVFRSTILASDGRQIVLAVECAVGRSLTLEAATGFGFPFATLAVTNPAASPVTFAVPIDATHRILRARTD